jgi:hypothetical protein
MARATLTVANLADGPTPLSGAVGAYAGRCPRFALLRLTNQSKAKPSIAARREANQRTAHVGDGGTTDEGPLYMRYGYAARSRGWLNVSQRCVRATVAGAIGPQPVDGATVGAGVCKWGVRRGANVGPTPNERHERHSTTRARGFEARRGF